uniref:hypothetical protein n=1 Tax=Nonomuraea bangladeshensis TaxID=404385 RepID=UPI003F49A9BC
MVRSLLRSALLAVIRRTVARHYGRTGPDWSAWRHDLLYLWIENGRKNATMLLRRAKTATKKDAWFPGLTAVHDLGIETGLDLGTTAGDRPPEEFRGAALPSGLLAAGDRLRPPADGDGLACAVQQ